MVENLFSSLEIPLSSSFQIHIKQIKNDLLVKDRIDGMAETGIILYYKLQKN